VCRHRVHLWKSIRTYYALNFQRSKKERHAPAHWPHRFGQYYSECDAKHTIESEPLSIPPHKSGTKTMRAARGNCVQIYPVADFLFSMCRPIATSAHPPSAIRVMLIAARRREYFTDAAAGEAVNQLHGRWMVLGDQSRERHHHDGHDRIVRLAE